MIEYYEIEKGIPISGGRSAAWMQIASKMEVGDSIVVRTYQEEQALISALKLKYGKCVDGKVTKATVKCAVARSIDTGPNGLQPVGRRVWRIA